MLRIVVMLVVFLAGTMLHAQERPATVVLDDGRVLAGTVVGIDLGTLQLRVDGEVLSLATADIQSCKFEGDETAAAPTTPQANAAPAEGTVVAAPDADDVPAAGKTVTAVAQPKARTPRTRGPLPDPVVPGDPTSVPHDLRYRSRLAARLHVIDANFPWLVPTEPAQWISLGLLLFACLSLVVHMSVSVVGAEAPGFGRSMLIALWYELTAFLQMAMVPSAHVATFSMLIGNTAMALFWLRNLFGVSRGGAMVAFAVQLGFLVLGYGLLEMVTSLLGSIDPLPA